MRSIFTIAFLLCTCLLSSSCDLLVKREIIPENEGRTMENKWQALRDIPLPKNFIIINDSLCFASGDFRYGKFHLQGTGNMVEIFNYFIAQMKRQAWEQRDVELMDTAFRAHFSKRGERCVIRGQESLDGDQKLDISITVEQDL